MHLNSMLRQMWFYLKCYIYLKLLNVNNSVEIIIHEEVSCYSECVKRLVSASLAVFQTRLTSN